MTPKDITQIKKHLDTYITNVSVTFKNYAEIIAKGNSGQEILPTIKVLKNLSSKASEYFDSIAGSLNE